MITDINNSHLCKRRYESEPTANINLDLKLDPEEADRSSAEMKRELGHELRKINDNPSNDPANIVSELMDSLFSTSRVDKLLYSWFFDRSYHEDISVRLAWMIRTLGECSISFELNSDCVMRIFNAPVLSIHFTEFTPDERRLVVQMISDWRLYFGEKKRFKTGGSGMSRAGPQQFAVFRKSPHNAMIATRVCPMRLCARLFALILMNARANPRAPLRVPCAFVRARMIMDKTVQNYEQRRFYTLTTQAERETERNRLLPLRELLDRGIVAIIYGWTAESEDFLPQLSLS